MIDAKRIEQTRAAAHELVGEIEWVDVYPNSADFREACGLLLHDVGFVAGVHAILDVLLGLLA
jgi:hypothetical protein